MTIGFDASRARLKERAGPENYTYNLLRELLRIDRENFYRLYTQLSASSFLSTFQLRTSNFEWQAIRWPRLWTQGGLALECWRRPPDVLFIPAHTIPVMRRPGLRTVVTIHDVGFQKFLEQYQSRWWRLYGGRISNYAARAATYVIAVSESTKRDLIEQLGVEPDKIVVVYEGVNHEVFRQQCNNVSSLRSERSASGGSKTMKQLRGKYGIDGKYLLFVGTVQPRKNIVRLIEAFQKALSSPNPPNSLIVAGKRGWLANEIYEAPKKFGVEDRVKFLGFVPTEDIISLMNGAASLVFPSLYEGFGLPVLEAMACGCPVVTSNISSLPEVVGEAGILVDPYSVEDIARGITEVLQLSDAQRQILVEKGIKQAKKFTWEKTARETLEVFRQVFYDRGKNANLD
jgi:glycosyltransferase involved in cell wall biosynthesis